MSRSLRRGTLAASAIAFSIASLAACGAGNDAQTLGVRPDNAATSIGDITIQNATVITEAEPGAGAGADTGSAATVTAKLFNDGSTEQTLDAITLPGTGTTVKVTPAKGSGPVRVPANGSVLLGGEGNASAVIENGSEAARNGDAQAVVFQFSETGDVELRAFVQPASGTFKDFGPSALPQEPSGEAPGEQDQESGSPSGEPSGSASEGAADGGTDGASGGPSDTESETPGGDAGMPTDAASASANTGG